MGAVAEEGRLLVWLIYFRHYLFVFKCYLSFVLSPQLMVVYIILLIGCAKNPRIWDVRKILAKFKTVRSFEAWSVSFPEPECKRSGSRETHPQNDESFWRSRSTQTIRGESRVNLKLFFEGVEVKDLSSEETPEVWLENKICRIVEHQHNKIEIDESKIKEILSKLQTNKACGPDRIGNMYWSIKRNYYV